MQRCSVALKREYPFDGSNHTLFQMAFLTFCQKVLVYYIYERERERERERGGEGGREGERVYVCVHEGE